MTPPCGEKKIITQDVRSRAYYPLNVVILTISILYNISAPRMSDSVESNVLLRSTSLLERAFESESDLAHHLNKEGYLKDDDYDDVINPKTMLSRKENASILAGGIKNKVEQNPQRYHEFLKDLRLSPRKYGDVVDLLDKHFGEYLIQGESVANKIE